MSTDNLSLFFEKAAADRALKDRLTAFAQLPLQEALKATVALAQQHGFAVTVEELREAVKARTGSELSAEELDGVTGGSHFAGVPKQINDGPLPTQPPPFQGLVRFFNSIFS